VDTIFLACFAIGLLFILASFVLGHGGHAGHAHAGSDGETPLWNLSSVVGGVTWFGAAGYVLTRLGGWAWPGAIVGALIGGAIGWYLVARFLGLILKGEVEMDPADYRLEGTVGKISVSIPTGGTGEILFEKNGTRRSEAARAINASAIARGTEVVITKYADGFAIVQPWGEFLAERDALAAPAKKKEG
jgi:membrane protein implicated in regulation of membrane protease activity